MDEIIKNQFAQIFKHKGNIGPIAEKANRNFEIITKNEVNKLGRIHHFIVGHAFKNIDKDILEYQFDEIKKTVVPTTFLKLQFENFNFEADFKHLVEQVRNLNSHYVHTFDNIECSAINSNVIEFVRQAFLFSILNVYLSEKSISYTEYKEQNTNILVKFLCDKFYPNKEHQIEVREKFKSLKLNEAIDFLLFIHVTEDFEWKLNEEHSVFTVKKGTYLSFYAQLFILMLSLYKQEATLLISKIQGFKKSENQFQFKRDIFTYLSKKVSSQDINSEEKNLIRFRDIIQYLNKYPTEWTKNLEPERAYSEMTNQLEKFVIEQEIFRSFPKFEASNRQKFLKYAVGKLFKTKKHLFDFNSITFSKQEEIEFQYEVVTSKKVKDIDLKISDIKSGKNRRARPNDIRKLNSEREKEIEKPNIDLEKLKKRISQDSLLKSYGRNQDRFMQMAIRFLAEENYFGEDVLFKTYQFYTTDEQNKYLEVEKNALTKKAFDKLKYHQGKLVYFTTFAKHLEKYPEWDMPFVIENNAFQIKIKISDKDFELVSIQRALLPYFLEDALYSNGNGKELLTQYFNSLMNDFNALKDDLETISPTHKKLFPSRFLQQHYAPNRNNEPENEHPYQKLLDQANEKEERYRLLLEKAQKLGTDEDFLKKNKGKNFKLRFVKKAWHLLFFRPVYDKQFEQHSHHKRFNITKEEFNDFSKWMYAFDEIPQYKDYLRTLFSEKQFLNVKDFAQIIESGHSLFDFYDATKKYLANWIDKNSLATLHRKNDYADIFEKKIVYINLSHFIAFLEKENKLSKNAKGHILFKSVKNTAYLISEWYYKDILPSHEYKTNAKLFNKLRKTKLEDALLYELAMRYLHKDKSIVEEAKTDVRQILNSTISFQIKDVNEKDLYRLDVAFNKLETLAILIQHKTEQLANPLNKKTSFLTNLDGFIKLLEDEKENKDLNRIYGHYNRYKKLTFEQLNVINNYIIGGSVQFSQIHMVLERYFITKFKTIISKKGRIDIADIIDEKGKSIFDKYYNNKERIRQKAYHFGVPAKLYKKALFEVENKFIQNEIKPFNFKNYQEIDKNKQTVCTIFMSILHHTLYKRDKNKTIEEKRKDFENQYFKQYLSK